MQRESYSWMFIVNNVMVWYLGKRNYKLGKRRNSIWWGEYWTRKIWTWRRRYWLWEGWKLFKSNNQNILETIFDEVDCWWIDKETELDWILIRKEKWIVEIRRILNWAFYWRCRNGYKWSTYYFPFKKTVQDDFLRKDIFRRWTK